MTPPERSAPLITITDPSRPLRWTEPVPAGVVTHRPSVPWLRPPERLVLLALTLLLVSGFTSTGRIQQEQRLSQRLADVDLNAVLAGGTVSGRAELTARLLLFARSAEDVALSGLAVDNGWQVSAMAPSTVAGGSLVTVSVTHDIDCGVPLKAPSRLQLVAGVPGGGSRSFALGIDRPVPGVLPEAARLCGDVDADQAVVLTSSSIVRAPGATFVEVRLANRGVDPVRVVGAVYPGFDLRPVATLPLTLTGRVPGLIEVASLPSRPVRFGVRVTDCADARVAMDGAARSDPVDLVELLVDGRGGAGSTRVDVQGVLAYLETAWAQAC